MQVINLNDYRKEGAAIARPSPCKPSSVIDKSERHRKRRVWREAEDIADYYLALQRFASAAHRAAKADLEPAKEAIRSFLDDYSYAVIVTFGRKAVADMIRTPAPTQQQIWWKKRQLKRDPFLVEFISAEEVTAAIAADEAFHRANPSRKPKAKKDGAE